MFWWSNPLHTDKIQRQNKIVKIPQKKWSGAPPPPQQPHYNINSNRSEKQMKQCLKCNLQHGPTWIICKISGFLFNHQRRREALAGRTTNHGAVLIHWVVVFLLKAVRWERDVWLRHLPLVYRTSFPWHCWQRRKWITGFRKLAAKSGK